MTEADIRRAVWAEAITLVREYGQSSRALPYPSVEEVRSMIATEMERRAEMDSRKERTD